MYTLRLNRTCFPLGWCHTYFSENGFPFNDRAQTGEHNAQGKMCFSVLANLVLAFVFVFVFVFVFGVLDKG